MAEIPAMVNIERKALFDELQGLDDEQWSIPTACEPWTVRHVVAHMTAVGNSTTRSFLGGLIRSGLNFGRFTTQGLERYDKGSNAEVLARFSQTLESPNTPPGPRYIVLGEIMCHSEDIRRALGYRGGYREEHLVTLADAYRHAPPPIGGRKRANGLRLIATDVTWSAGDGPEVTGPGNRLDGGPDELSPTCHRPLRIRVEGRAPSAGTKETVLSETWTLRDVVRRLQLTGHAMS